MNLKRRHFVNSQNAGKFVEEMKNILASEDIKNMFYVVGVPYNKMYDAMFIMDGEYGLLTGGWTSFVAGILPPH